VEIRLAAQIGDINLFLSDALKLFFNLRDSLRKKPATAELLNWLLVLRKVFQGVDNPFVEHREQTVRTFSALVKTKDDQKAAKQVFERFQPK